MHRLNIDGLSNLNDYLFSAEYNTTDAQYRIRLDASTFKRCWTAKQQEIIFLTIIIERVVEDTDQVEVHFKYSTDTNPDAVIKTRFFPVLQLKNKLLDDISNICVLRKDINQNV